VATPLLAGAVVSIAGFGTEGVLAVTWAASFVASYGGAVSAGSTCALFQSIGAAGLGYGGAALLASLELLSQFHSLHQELNYVFFSSVTVSVPAGQRRCNEHFRFGNYCRDGQVQIVTLIAKSQVDFGGDIGPYTFPTSSKRPTLHPGGIGTIVKHFSVKQALLGSLWFTRNPGIEISEKIIIMITSGTQTRAFTCPQRSSTTGKLILSMRGPGTSCPPRS
jgi:hypothetical protein